MRNGPPDVPKKSPDTGPRLRQNPNDVALMQQAERAMRAKYDAENDEVLDRIWMFGGRLAEAFGSLDGVRSKRILDLGCGRIVPEDMHPAITALSAERARGVDISKSPELERMAQLTSLEGINFMTGEVSGRYEPWFPRLVLELGGSAVGIDAGNLDGEAFEHYQLDLTQPGALDFLPDKSFDLLHSRSLQSSPTFGWKARGKDRIHLFQLLLEDARQKLKDGGKMLITE